MQGISQLPTSTNQVADSASSVASALSRPRTASTQTTNASTGAGSSPSSVTSTITSNDFLTLLVAEMKNQDPTQPTDPNAYISQMVDVNSLQQLIGINQGITTLDTATGASVPGTTSGSAS
jgi:flagellar basal-body rod modification protein FlgD